MTEPFPFLLFGLAHVVSIVLVLLLVFIVPLSIKRMVPAMQKQIGRAIAIMLVLNEILSMFVAVFIYNNPLGSSLPLHLCGLAALLTAWMLWRQSYRSYEVAYFLAIGGSIPAMLTPDLSLGFPHPTFIHFFAGHGLIMFGVLYATICYEFRPTFMSVVRATVASLILMLVMGPINLLLDTNYMYLCQKPAQNTLMDYFGPWPWYLVSLVGIGLFVFILCYLPFKFFTVRNKGHGY